MKIGHKNKRYNFGTGFERKLKRTQCDIHEFLPIISDRDELDFENDVLLENASRSLDASVFFSRSSLNF